MMRFKRGHFETLSIVIYISFDVLCVFFSLLFIFCKKQGVGLRHGKANRNTHTFCYLG